MTEQEFIKAFGETDHVEDFDYAVEHAAQIEDCALSRMANEYVNLRQQLIAAFNERGIKTQWTA